MFRVAVATSESRRVEPRPFRSAAAAAAVAAAAVVVAVAAVVVAAVVVVVKPLRLPAPEEARRASKPRDPDP